MLTVLCLSLLMSLSLTAQLRKQWLFKVDPASFLFKEFRVAIEQRVAKDKNYFWYIAPYGHYQRWTSRDRNRFNRPDYPQNYYGAGIRLGIRRYFIPKDMSPHGFFAQAHLGLRHTWLVNYTDDLQIDNKTRYFQGGIGAAVGYQWLTGPKDNFTYGFIGGVEFYPLLEFKKTSQVDVEELTRNWYDIPFIGDRYHGFRVYLGIEVGFAFLQKNLHW